MSRMPIQTIRLPEENSKDAVDAYKNRLISGRFLPTTYFIEPTSACNLDCIMCPNGQLKETGVMNFATYKSTIDQIADYAKAIMLYFVGEPLLNKNIVEMIQYCKSKSNAKLILSTNATMLEGQLAFDIADSDLDEIVLCLDGNSQKTYGSIRRGGDFSEVKRNIIDFLLLMEGKETPKRIVQIVAQKQNEPEIEDFYHFWQGYDCEIKVQWLDTWANQMPELVPLAVLANPNEAMSRVPCADLWMKAVINWKGNVVLCCHDAFESSVLGNVNEESIETIWHGDRLQKIRKAHIEKAFHQNPLCANCSEWSTVQDEFAYFIDEREPFFSRRP